MSRIPNAIRSSSWRVAIAFVVFLISAAFIFQPMVSTHRRARTQPAEPASVIQPTSAYPTSLTGLHAIPDTPVSGSVGRPSPTVPVQKGTPTVTADPTTPDDPHVYVEVDQSQMIGISNLTLGVTHTQDSLNPWGDSEAIERGKQILAESATFQNQTIFGWGTLNPEPSPGEYDWTTLDRRISLIRETRGIPVITLCCAPDWMKGGADGTTNWSNLSAAPFPEYYNDFAILAREIAERYPDVQYFQVWSDMRGFWDTDLRRWNYEGYTELYNAVYDAIKGVNQDAQIGGPFVRLHLLPAANANGSQLVGSYGSVDQRDLDVLSYWLQHKHGAEFVALHAALPENRLASDELIAQSQLWDDVTAWIRSQPNGGSELPIWWSQWYDLTYQSASRAATQAALAMNLARIVQSGAAVALSLQPEDRHWYTFPIMSGPRPFLIGQPTAFWTDTRKRFGGTRLPFAATHELFRLYFGDGTPLYKASSSSPMIIAMASASHVLLINSSSADTQVTIGTTSVTLRGYEIRLLDATSGERPDLHTEGMCTTTPGC